MPLLGLWGKFLRLYAFSCSFKAKLGAESFSFVFPKVVPWNTQVSVPSPNSTKSDWLKVHVWKITSLCSSFRYAGSWTQGEGWGTWRSRHTHTPAGNVPGSWYVSLLMVSVADSKVCSPLKNFQVLDGISPTDLPISAFQPLIHPDPLRILFF